MRQNVHIMLGSMVRRRETLATAYRAVKLATLLMTTQECVPLLAGLTKTSFFDNIAARVKAGCDKSSELEFSLAVAKLFRRLIKTACSLSEEELVVVWRTQRKFLQWKVSHGYKTNKFEAKYMNNQEHFPGKDMFIANELRFSECTEVWLSSILFIYALHLSELELADKLAMIVADCLEKATVF